ncbi:FAD-dependent oxidoreductase [bacterium]|nr:FAD-dependent oxidoreductase [bacterium]
MRDWLIIGGGIHGTHLALVLTAAKAVPPERVRILDPHVTPLARWRQLTDNAGVRFLRSPMVHHLGLREFPIDRFVRTSEARPYRKFIPPYNRPALKLFNAHADRVIADNGLADLFVQGRAAGLARIDGGWRVTTEAGAVIDARRVLLAPGVSDQPRVPDWAAKLRAAGAAVQHVFDEDFDRHALPPWESLVVVGAGLSAVECALALAARGHQARARGESASGGVTILARHEVRVSQFDSDPGWVGPKYLDGFSRVTDYAERRRLIREARQAGSVPPNTARRLRRALREWRVGYRLGEAIDAKFRGNGMVLEFLDGSEIVCDRVVLATGSLERRPGGAWLDRAVEELSLPIAPCGFPVPSDALEWAPGLHVTGALAELELGPAARNIVGARNAGERFVRI